MHGQLFGGGQSRTCNLAARRTGRPNTPNDRAVRSGNVYLVRANRGGAFAGSLGNRGRCVAAKYRVDRPRADINAGDYVADALGNL